MIGDTYTHKSTNQECEVLEVLNKGYVIIAFNDHGKFITSIAYLENKPSAYLPSLWKDCIWQPDLIINKSKKGIAR